MCLEDLLHPVLHGVLGGLVSLEDLKVPIALVCQVDLDFLVNLEVQCRLGYQEYHLDRSHHPLPFLLVDLEGQQILAFHLVPALHSSHLIHVHQ